MEVLARSDWEARAAAHAARIDAYVQPHLARRREGVKHPVFDFLFTYYAHRPAQLRRWHPGFGVGLDDCEPARGYRAVPLSEAYGARSGGRPVVAVPPDYVASQRVLIETLLRLLRATAGRAANFGCFGLHEWAMVYRLTEDETRHADWPLRLGPTGTDEVVESHRIACSHFDAYRFFTAPARPLNLLSPGRDDRADFEQPGCLHGNMDLYKHAFRLSPMISSNLVADCFELAWEIRTLDMRAAPYDLADLGFQPLRIETPEGKKEYAAHQRAFADRATPLRARLIDECERLFAMAGSVSQANVPGAPPSGPR